MLMSTLDIQMASVFHALFWRDFEVSHYSKFCWTELTLKWFLNIMNYFHVFLKVTTQSKCSWACFTLNWLQGFMNSCDVRIETTSVSKFQGTQLAFKWFQIFMDCSYVFLRLLLCPNFVRQREHLNCLMFSW